MNVVTGRVCHIDRPSEPMSKTASEPMSMTALRKIADDGKPLLMRGSSLDTVINALAIGVIAAIGITLLGVTTALTAFPPTTLLGVAAGIVILSVAKHCLFNSQNAKWYKELNGTDAKAAPEPVRKAVQEAFHSQEIPATLPTGLSLTGLINLTANNKDAAQALIKDPLTEIKDLSTDQIQALSPLHIQALSTDQIQALSTDQIQALSTDQIQALSTDQIQALSPLHIQALSTDQIQALSTDQIQALSPLHIQALSTDQIKDLSTEQIKALSKTQLEAINLDTLKAISDSIGKRNMPEENMLLLFSSLQALHHKQFVPTGTTLEFNLEHPSLGFLQILRKYSVDISDKAFGQQEQVDTFLSTFIPGQVYTIDGTFIDPKEEYQQGIVYGQLQRDLVTRGEGPEGKKSYWLDDKCVSLNRAERNETNTERTDTDFIQSLHKQLENKFGSEETRTLPILFLLSQVSEATLANILANTCVFPKCITFDSNSPDLKSTTKISLEKKTYTCTTTTPMLVTNSENRFTSANSFIFTLKMNLDTQDMRNLKYTLTIQSTNPKTTLK